MLARMVLHQLLQLAKRDGSQEYLARKQLAQVLCRHMGDYRLPMVLAEVHPMERQWDCEVVHQLEHLRMDLHLVVDLAAEQLVAMELQAVLGQV